jgi:uncharacterized protein (DUF305 family)
MAACWLYRPFEPAPEGVHPANSTGSDQHGCGLLPGQSSTTGTGPKSLLGEQAAVHDSRSRTRSDDKEGIVPGRLARAIAITLLGAGCAPPNPHASTPAPAATDQIDVWFMQHMVPHLWQTTSIAFLTRDRITHPALTRLADTINQRSQTDIQQLQEWLSQQGLAPHGHSHQRADNRKQTDLERLSRLHGTAFDLAFLQVMTARDLAGIKLAMIETSQGNLPEVRQLARQLLVEQQARVRQMDDWTKAWSKSSAAGNSS